MYFAIFYFFFWWEGVVGGSDFVYSNRLYELYPRSELRGADAVEHCPEGGLHQPVHTYAPQAGGWLYFFSWMDFKLIFRYVSLSSYRKYIGEIGNKGKKDAIGLEYIKRKIIDQNYDGFMYRLFHESVYLKIFILLLPRMSLVPWTCLINLFN